jgi:hypothetical protein
MGLLNDLRESAARINPALLMTEDKDSAYPAFPGWQDLTSS